MLSEYSYNDYCISYENVVKYIRKLLLCRSIGGLSMKKLGSSSNQLHFVTKEEIETFNYRGVRSLIKFQFFSFRFKR